MVACVRAGAPPTEVPRAGWLHDVALPTRIRDATACERAAALGDGEVPLDASDGIVRALDADLDGDGRDERVVIAQRREIVVAITDVRCAVLWRGTFAPARAQMVGPSGPNLWEGVSPDEVSRLYATDRLPLGGTRQLYLLRGEGAHRHALILQTGSVGTLQYGWRALVLGCHRGACRGDLIGHREWAAIPASHGCGPTFRPNRPPPDSEVPLLRVEPGDAPGALVVTAHARARDTCGAAAETVRALAPFQLAP